MGSPNIPGGLTTDRGWHGSFDDPIPLPDGSELRTLRDAGNYIAKLPKGEHDTFAWRAAIEALMLVAEHGGDTMLPRVGIMRALYPGEAAPPQSVQRAFATVLHAIDAGAAALPHSGYGLPGPQSRGPRQSCASILL